MIITLDGPAGSGKSTVARKLAARLEIAYLDTGAMYRAVALAAIQRGVSLDDPDALAEVARQVELTIECAPTYPRVLLDGHDVSEQIRSMEVSRATSAVARVPAIRALLAGKQRQIGKQLGSLVAEGRDQGTAVFPDAEVKVILEAAIEKRAERRYLEMLADGQEVDREQVLESLAARDGVDAVQWEPLLDRPDVLRLDTTEMTITQVVDRLAEHIRSARGGRQTDRGPR